MDKCPALSSADGYKVHSSFTAEGCAPGGRATVKLLVRSSNFELDRTNIYVEAYTPTPTRRPSPTETPTPTPTPTPDGPPPTNTPTPTPVCNPIDLGVLSFFSGSQPKTHPEYGAWNTPCYSRYKQDQGLGNVHAKLYTFELTKASHVIIGLTSSTQRLDPFLVLWEGEQWPYVGNPIMVNNDNDEFSTTGSRMGLELGIGTYIVEATLDQELSSISPSIRKFTLEITVAELITYLGHQADFTVQYKIGIMPPTRTPIPTPSTGSVLTPTPTPALLPDPGVKIPEGIPTAVAAWNTAVATSWPYLVFCEGKPATPTLPHITPIPCGTRTHDDGASVTIDVEDGSTERTVLTWAATWNCGRATACVKPDPDMFLWNLNPVGNGDIGNLRMVVEEEAWAYKPAGLFGAVID